MNFKYLNSMSNYLFEQSAGEQQKENVDDKSDYVN